MGRSEEGRRPLQPMGRSAADIVHEAREKIIEMSAYIDEHRLDFLEADWDRLAEMLHETEELLNEYQ